VTFPISTARILCLALLLASASVGAQSPTANTPAFDGLIRAADYRSLDIGTEVAYLPAIFPSAHAANLLRLHNGDLLCFWFSGTWEGESDVAIVMSRLPHNSNRWTQTTIIDHQPGKSYQNPVAFQSPDGRIWLLHTSQTANHGQGDAQVWQLISTDDGNTWSAPSLLFAAPGSFTRHPPILNRQRWVLPVFFTPGEGGTGERSRNYSATEISRDQGQHWQECPITGTLGLLVQPTLVPNGSGYIAWFRSRNADWIYRSESNDGCIWAQPQPTQLPNNNASVQALRLSNGHIVMTFDNSAPYEKNGKRIGGPRKPLSIALSIDNGITWPWVRDLETGDLSTKEWNTPRGHDEYSYPTVVQDQTGRIVVAYSWQRSTIKVLKFDEVWIRSGSTAGSYSGVAASH